MAQKDKSGDAPLPVVDDHVAVPPVGYFFKGFLAWWCLWGHIPVVDSMSTTTMKSTLGKASTSFGKSTAGTRRMLKRKVAASDQEGGKNYTTTSCSESNSTATMKVRQQAIPQQQLDSFCPRRLN